MSAEQHEQAEIADEINLNYDRLLQSREAGDSPQLQAIFEQRMNNALDKYMDLARFMTQAVLLEAPEGA